MPIPQFALDHWEGLLTIFVIWPVKKVWDWVVSVNRRLKAMEEMQKDCIDTNKKLTVVMENLSREVKHSIDEDHRQHMHIMEIIANRNKQ